jgi:oligopeptide/dipeptide ABC transporter ATP-binding protein
MIAMAISLDPAVLIADEPTTALDATVQARILRLLSVLRRQHGLAVLLITHDLGVAARVATFVAVMYGTVIVEYGLARKVIDNPLHPYTQGLVASIPRGHWTTNRLASIGGRPPQLAGAPVECPYRDRCPEAYAACAQLPALAMRIAPGGADRVVRCHLYEPLAG